MKLRWIPAKSIYIWLYNYIVLISPYVCSKTVSDTRSDDAPTFEKSSLIHDDVITSGRMCDLYRNLALDTNGITINGFSSISISVNNLNKTK